MSYIYHINVLLSSIINQTNKNVALIPRKLESRTTLAQGLSMDYSMYFFPYLAKVNLGGKVVHLTRTLSQDFCSLMCQCIIPTFSPYFCLAHIFKQACVM